MYYTRLFTNNELNLNIYTFLLVRGRIYNIQSDYIAEYFHKCCVLYCFRYSVLKKMSQLITHKKYYYLNFV